MSLGDLEFSYKLFLNKSTIAYGVTDSGKSTIIKCILHAIAPFVQQCIVICPNDAHTGSYSGSGLIARPCIYKTITDKFLTNLWERQEALSLVYKRANDPATVRGLFDRISTPASRAIIEIIERKHAECVNKIQEDVDEEAVARKIKETTEEAEKLTMALYKHFIKQNIDRLQKMQLTNNEKTSILYIDLNVNIAVIFDDCTPDLEKFKKHTALENIFYAGRHNHITIIVACHNDKVITPELKKSAFVSIFCEPACARVYFDKKSTALDAPAKKHAMDCIRQTFIPTKRYQKLVLLKSDGMFYKYTASVLPDFEFGAPIIREFCRRIQVDQDDIGARNRYMSKFTVT